MLGWAAPPCGPAVWIKSRNRGVKRGKSFFRSGLIGKFETITFWLSSSIREPTQGSPLSPALSIRVSCCGARCSSDTNHPSSGPLPPPSGWSYHLRAAPAGVRIFICATAEPFLSSGCLEVLFVKRGDEARAHQRAVLASFIIQNFVTRSAPPCVYLRLDDGDR